MAEAGDDGAGRADPRALRGLLAAGRMLGAAIRPGGFDEAFAADDALALVVAFGRMSGADAWDGGGADFVDRLARKAAARAYRAAVAPVDALPRDHAPRYTEGERSALLAALDALAAACDLLDAVAVMTPAEREAVRRGPGRPEDVDLNREIARRRGLGEKSSVIARSLGLTTKAVDNRYARWRKGRGMPGPPKSPQ